MRSLFLSAALGIAITTPAFAQSISESPNPAAPNAALSVSFSDPGAQVNDNIWIQDANGNHLEVLYLNGTSSPPSSPITSGTITSFTAPATAGSYNIYGGFHGTAVGPVAFTVSAAGPTPTGITYTPTYGLVVDTSASGAVAGGFVVTMSDGSTYNGTNTLLSGSDALCIVPASGNGNITISRALTSADAASQHICKLQASENGTNKEVDFQFNVEKAVQFTDTSYVLPGITSGYVLGVSNGAFAMIPQSGGGSMNTIWNGTGAPASTLGANGDFYIDTAANAIYGPKASGAWPSSGVSLVGPRGATGATGATGAQGPAGQNGTNAGQQGLFTPTSSTMACSQGQSGFDATYIYGCLATNQWGRMGGGQTSWQTTGW